MKLRLHLPASVHYPFATTLCGLRVTVAQVVGPEDTPTCKNCIRQEK